MNKNYINLRIWTLPAISLIIAAVSLLFLPDQIPIRWDNAGNAQMASRYTILLIPAIGAIVLLLGHIVPVIDPKREAYGQIAKEYTFIHLLVLLLLLGAELFTIVSSLGVALNPMMFGYIAVGLLLAAIGNYLPKLPQTYLTGVKTIWGYHSEAVWTKIHRMAGKLWFFGGLALIILAFIPMTFPVNLVVIAVLVVTPRLYGMAVSIRMQKKSNG